MHAQRSLRPARSGWRCKTGVFTQTFTADRRVLAEILNLLPQQPDLLTKRRYTSGDRAHPLGVGWNKIEGMRGWLRMSGLIQPVAGSRAGEWELTDVGALVALRDPHLSRLTTWWVLHVRWGMNPEATVYWQLCDLVSTTPKAKAELVAAIHAREPNLSRASIEADATGVLGSFATDGSTKLANLGAIVQTTDVPGAPPMWARGTPENLHIGVVAYALYLIRENYHPSAPSMDLGSLCQAPGGLNAVLSLSTQQLRNPLRRLHSLIGDQGYVFTETAGLDSVTFGRTSAFVLLERYMDGELRDEVEQ